MMPFMPKVSLFFIYVFLTLKRFTIMRVNTSVLKNPIHAPGILCDVQNTDSRKYIPNIYLYKVYDSQYLLTIYKSIGRGLALRFGCYCFISPVPFH